MRLCDKWKIDTSKKGRDLGEFIRREIIQQFSQGEASRVDDLKDCERKFKCLNRLANNHYGNKYKRRNNYTASELTLEQCHLLLSTEALKFLEEDSKGYIYQFKKRLMS